MPHFKAFCMVVYLQKLISYLFIFVDNSFQRLVRQSNESNFTIRNNGNTITWFASFKLLPTFTCFKQYTV